MLVYDFTGPMMPILIWGTLLLIIVKLYASVVRPRHLPAQVKELMPWIGSTLKFCSDPCGYMRLCYKSYGANYSFFLGSRRVIVMSSLEGIRSIYRDRSRALNTAFAHQQVLTHFGPFTSSLDFMHNFQTNNVFPLVANGFSNSSMADFSPALVAGFITYFNAIPNMSSTPSTVKLQTISSGPTYKALAFAVLGPLYSSESYEDSFHTFDSAIGDIVMKPTPFADKAGKEAGRRLHTHMRNYIDKATKFNQSGDIYLEGCSSAVNAVFQDCVNSQLNESDTVSSMVLFIWGLHAGICNMAFWMMAYLLDDPKAIVQLRREISSAVPEQYESIFDWIAADPYAINGPAFPLLSSAINETLRLSARSNPMRQATSDISMSVNGTPIDVQQGDMLLGDMVHLHYDRGLYGPGPEQFSIDRFVKKNDAGPTCPIIGWGGGEHICKGRHFAKYTLKLFIVILFDKYDFAAIPGIPLPEPKPRSLSIASPLNDIPVSVWHRHG